MIKVYIETGSHAECVATIQDEWVYMALLPSLEKLALEWGGILTESIVEDTPKPCVPESVYLLMSATKHDVYDNGSVIKAFPTMDKAKAHMEEVELFYKEQDFEMCDYWIKEYKYEK
jgi:hypothetical protein